jgi:hypothetical protein
MAITNGLPKGYQPKTKQDIWILEQKRLKEVLVSLSSQQSSLALSALNMYMLDKIDLQKHADSEVFSCWDQILWYIEDMAVDDLPSAIRQQACLVLQAKDEDYLGELVILSNGLAELYGKSHQLNNLLQLYVDELEVLRRNLITWLDKHISPIPDDVHSEKVGEALRRLESLIRIVETGFVSLFHKGWLCSSLEQTFLTQLHAQQLVFPEYEY